MFGEGTGAAVVASVGKMLGENNESKMVRF
jgi:hypothetical protein